ncbi:netrin receptor DCC [Epargyreus clarus]|uniref:netrin receptor DCC n=1 Tax=Epargyreus clarus TaxID=520877 RepID=UPI003C2B27D4
MWRTEVCRFGYGNWIFLVACTYLFTWAQGGDDEQLVKFTVEPSDLVVGAGERAALACGAAAGARVSWRHSSAAPPTRDHSLPPDDTYRKQLPNGTLVIESMSATLAGQYQCVAALDGVGTVVSRVATVFLAEVPEFVEVGRVISGVSGAAALIPCGLAAPARLALRVLPAPAAPAPPERRVYGAARLHAPPPVLKLNVTWLKNGIPVRLEGARATLTASGALELDPLRPHDAAAYRCRVALASDHRQHRHVTGPEIDVRVNTELANLEYAPRFITTPQPVTVMEGASVTFDCAAVGNPKPEMVWLNNGVAIDLNDLDSRFYLVGAGSLRVQSARALDAGAYTCRATNRLDSADHSTQLHVMTPPRVTLPAGRAVSARAAGDATLRCAVRGRPPPVTAWLKDGEPLTPNHHDIALVDGTSLRIQGVLSVDAGVFQCSASSPAGSATAALRLVVLPPEEDSKSGGMSQPNLEPKPVPLPNHPNGTHDIFNSLIEAPEEPDYLGETSSAYTSEPLEYDYNNVDYSFHAADDYIDDLKPVNGTIVSAPKELKAVIVKHRFVTLSWEEPEHKLEEITGYAVVYSVKGSERSRVSRGPAQRREMNVAALQPNTTYTFSARAYTRSAASPHTQLLEVSTPEEEVSFGPPRDVRLTALGAHALRVTWAAPPLPPGGAPPAKYQVFYTEVESGREQTQFAEGLSAEVSGLRAAAAYRVRVAAVGGAASAELAAATPSDAPAAPPGNVTAQAASDTSILVRWEAPPARSHRGALTGYKIRYRATGPAQGRRRAESLTTPADARRAELRGLDTATTYQIRVCAINANGSGPFSEWVSASTLGRERGEAAVPAAPPPLVTRAGRDWISVWWGGEGREEGARVRGYWLGWGLGVPDEHARDLPAHLHSHVIRGLESNSEYVISLRASNALGLGPAVYATVRTRGGADAGDEPDDDEPDDADDPDDRDDADDDTPALIPPIGLKVIMLSGTTAVVYWTDPSLPKGQTATDGRRYVVRYSSAGGRTRTYNATDLNCMLDDLRPYTHYEFAVKLIKGGRESPWSMIASNTTLEAAPASAPRDLRAAAAAPRARAIDLAWAPPLRPNGLLTGYVIMYAVQRGGAGAAEEWTALEVQGDRARTRVDRLRPRTTYLFKIQARNAKGLGPFSPTITYTTAVESGEGGGLPGATSAWLWASAGGACAVLALAAALALSLCCRRAHEPLEPHTSTYQKASASAAIKPPDLWIHHDQMELKHIDKSLHSSASKISAGSVDAPSALVSSTLTLARAPPAEYEPARHPHPHTHQHPHAHQHATHMHSLDRRMVPTYVEARSPSAGSDEPPTARASPAARRCDINDYRSEYLAMTGMGVGVGVGCASTCERRRHMPDQSTPLLAGVAPLGSPQSSLGSLHQPPPAPCGSGTCPLGAACSAPAVGAGVGAGVGVGPGVTIGGDVYACASRERERGHYVAYEPLGHYTHRDSLSSDAGGVAGSSPLPAAGSLPRRAHPLHSFAMQDADNKGTSHLTTRHTTRHTAARPSSVRETSPYKKSANSSPGHLPNRLQLGGGSASELEPLTPSRSTERLQREMQNLEGLMKDLSAITQHQFHC